MKNLKRILVVMLALMTILSSVAVSALAVANSSPQTINIKDCTISREGPSTYDGLKKKVVFHLFYNGVELVENVDFIVIGNETPSANAGVYTMQVTIKGIGAFSGELNKTVNYKIKKATQKISVDKKVIKVSAATLKKSAKTISIGLSISSKLSFLSAKSTSSKIKAYVKNGQIKLNKGLKAGIYFVTFSSKDATKAVWSKNYNAAKTVTVKIVVK